MVMQEYFLPLQQEIKFMHEDFRSLQNYIILIQEHFLLMQQGIRLTQEDFILFCSMNCVIKNFKEINYFLLRCTNWFYMFKKNDMRAIILGFEKE